MINQSGLHPRDSTPSLKKWPIVTPHASCCACAGALWMACHFFPTNETVCHIFKILQDVRSFTLKVASAWNIGATSIDFISVNERLCVAPSQECFANRSALSGIHGFPKWYING